jgi:hypothetical protein
MSLAAAADNFEDKFIYTDPADRQNLHKPKRFGA